jgi:hypothetical protein
MDTTAPKNESAVCRDTDSAFHELEDFEFESEEELSDEDELEAGCLKCS